MLCDYVGSGGQPFGSGFWSRSRFFCPIFFNFQPLIQATLQTLNCTFSPSPPSLKYSHHISWCTVRKMDPTFLALSRLKRRRFEQCIEGCTELLIENPLDQGKSAPAAPNPQTTRVERIKRTRRYFRGWVVCRIFRIRDLYRMSVYQSFFKGRTKPSLLMHRSLLMA